MEVNKDETKYYIKENNTTIAYIDYEENDNIIVYKVFVDENKRGLNLGYIMMKKLIDDSIKLNKKIIPYCSYAKKILEKEGIEYDNI